MAFHFRDLVFQLRTEFADFDLILRTLNFSSYPRPQRAGYRRYKRRYYDSDYFAAHSRFYCFMPMDFSHSDTSKLGQSFIHSLGSIFPLLFLSGLRSRCPMIFTSGCHLWKSSTYSAIALRCAAVLVSLGFICLSQPPAYTICLLTLL